MRRKGRKEGSTVRDAASSGEVLLGAPSSRRGSDATSKKLRGWPDEAAVAKPRTRGLWKWRNGESGGGFKGAVASWVQHMGR
jgi:hypothetical protein